MKAKVWTISWLCIVIAVLTLCGIMVYKIDPFFHYHKPDTEKYYYTLNNQRSQNDGVIKHFDYDAMITGSSMAANFRTSELDDLFGTESIKVTFNGGSYKEINDNIKNALDANPNLKMVVRSLDMAGFLSAYDAMRDGPEAYPAYLYDNKLFNDVKYLFNRDVVFGRILCMIFDKGKEDFEPGIDSFDKYSRWQSQFTFGINTVCPEGVAGTETEQVHLSDAEKKKIRKNIDLNVTDTADANPDVDFYYFYTPYSLASWNGWKTEGKLYKMLEAEAYITDLIIPHKNIHLFSFNNRTDITRDLNNYKDSVHYAVWVNSMVLKWMHDGEGKNEDCMVLYSGPRAHQSDAGNRERADSGRASDLLFFL